eukprot:IDg16672t1
MNPTSPVSKVSLAHYLLWLPRSVLSSEMILCSLLFLDQKIFYRPLMYFKSIFWISLDMSPRPYDSHSLNELVWLNAQENKEQAYGEAFNYLELCFTQSHPLQIIATNLADNIYESGDQ